VELQSQLSQLHVDSACVIYESPTLTNALSIHQTTCLQYKKMIPSLTVTSIYVYMPKNSHWLSQNEKQRTSRELTIKHSLETRLGLMVVEVLISVPTMNQNMIKMINCLQVHRVRWVTIGGRRQSPFDDMSVE
jgi:archaellum biogenesis protein FlaJ (TadC family)